MSRREENKEVNRRRILAAARALIQEGGLDALQMRTLAERAKVSSRTPYNLFGSKTAVLIGLLDAPLDQLVGVVPAKQAVLAQVFETLERAYKLYAPQQDYYRNIYWGVMTSDQAEAREVTLERACRVLAMLLQRAIDAGELAKVDAKGLAEHLVLLGLGLLGLWASKLIDGKQLLSHLRLAVEQSLQPHVGAGDKRRSGRHDAASPVPARPSRMRG